MFSVPVRVLKTRPLDHSVASGAPVTLGCDLGGQPLPAVTWLVRGVPVRPHGGHSRNVPETKTIESKTLIRTSRSKIWKFERPP